MPVDVVKGTYKYCMENKWFFLFVIIIFSILEFGIDFINSPVYIIAYLITSVFILGYGIQIIEDIINGGIRLPKIMPKKVVVYGLKGMVIRIFYVAIQLTLLSVVARNINFPVFELQELILNYHKTLLLIYNHDVVSFFIFVFSGFIISYVTSFFMELSLARLADGGQLRKSFNFPRIKHAIDVIGWRNYTIGYTKIILVMLFFYEVNIFFDPYLVLNIIMGTLSIFMAFIVEYRGMGVVYKLYTDTKKKSS